MCPGRQDLRNALVSNINIELYNALRYHMANGRLLTKDLKNGLKISSAYNGQSLHVNHYSNGVRFSQNVQKAFQCVLIFKMQT